MIPRPLNISATTEQHHINIQQKFSIPAAPFFVFFKLTLDHFIRVKALLKDLLQCDYNLNDYMAVQAIFFICAFTLETKPSRRLQRLH